MKSRDITGVTGVLELTWCYNRNITPTNQLLLPWISEFGIECRIQSSQNSEVNIGIGVKLQFSET